MRRLTFTMYHNIIDSDQYKRLSPSAKVLYITLCRLKDEYSERINGYWFYRSVRLLANDTGMNKDTVIKARESLIDSKFIQVQIVTDYRRRKATKYKLLPCHSFGHKLD